MTINPHILTTFKDKQVLVVGEMMLDCYFKGMSHRLSREAPVPIVDIEDKTDVPGGAANTALNVAALGAQTSFLSVGGKDYEAEQIMEQLWDKQIDVTGVYFDSDRETIAKKRIISDSQLLVRYDNGTKTPISRDTEIRLIHYLDQSFKTFDAIILSDYGYGVFTPGITKLIASLQQKYHKTLVVDSKNLALFNTIEITAIKPNYQQTAELLHLSPQDNNRIAQIKSVGARIFDCINTRIAACTVDVEGSVLFERGRDPFVTKTTPQPNTHAAGAGDTFVSALTVALAAGCTTRQAATIASKAAELVVQESGTTQCSLEHLKTALLPQKKVIEDQDILLHLVKQHKKAGNRIVFTNGCFDSIHSGHVAFLKEAKKHGDILIVGLNSDESVKQVTGKRPEHTVKERIGVLKELHIIDHIVPFSESIPTNLIRIIEPDTFVKGGNYTQHALPERSIIETYGGTIKILEFHDHQRSRSKKSQGATVQPILKSFSLHPLLL